MYTAPTREHIFFYVLTPCILMIFSRFSGYFQCWFPLYFHIDIGNGWIWAPLLSFVLSNNRQSYQKDMLKLTSKKVGLVTGQDKPVHAGPLPRRDPPLKGALTSPPAARSTAGSLETPFPFPSPSPNVLLLRLPSRLFAPKTAQRTP